MLRWHIYSDMKTFTIIMSPNKTNVEQTMAISIKYVIPVVFFSFSAATARIPMCAASKTSHIYEHTSQHSTAQRRNLFKFKIICCDVYITSMLSIWFNVNCGKHRAQPPIYVDINNQQYLFNFIMCIDNSVVFLPFCIHAVLVCLFFFAGVCRCL